MHDVMKVYLVRHTRTEVPPGICYGWSDVDVADTFPQEAADVRRHLSGIEFDQAYTSPLRRAVKLADYCGFAAAIRDDRLKEMNMGRWEMQSYDKIDDPALQEWYKDYMHLPATGGESFPDLKRRVDDFLDNLRGQGHRQVVVFAHGGVLMAAGLYAGLWKEDRCFELHSTPFGGIIEVDI